MHICIYAHAYFGFQSYPEKIYYPYFSSTQDKNLEIIFEFTFSPISYIFHQKFPLALPPSAFRVYDFSPLAPALSCHRVFNFVTAIAS